MIVPGLAGTNNEHDRGIQLVLCVEPVSPDIEPWMVRVSGDPVIAVMLEHESRYRPGGTLGEMTALNKFTNHRPSCMVVGWDRPKPFMQDRCSGNLLCCGLFQVFQQATKTRQHQPGSIIDPSGWCFGALVGVCLTQHQAAG